MDVCREDCAYRTGRSEAFSEALAILEGEEGTSGTAIIRERLDVDSLGAVVDDNGRVGVGLGSGGDGAEEGSNGGDGELHFGLEY